MKIASNLPPVAATLSALATLTCCLPIAFPAGLAAAGLGAVAVTHRSWFIGSSIGLLALGAVQYTRSRRACSTRSRAVTLTLLSLSAVVILGVVLFPQVVASILADLTG